MFADLLPHAHQHARQWCVLRILVFQKYLEIFSYIFGQNLNYLNANRSIKWHILHICQNYSKTNDLNICRFHAYSHFHAHAHWCTDSVYPSVIWQSNVNVYLSLHMFCILTQIQSIHVSSDRVINVNVYLSLRMFCRLIQIQFVCSSDRVMCMCIWVCVCFADLYWFSSSVHLTE